MKKLSLLFVFVLVLVAVLAFSASAKNITKEAEFSMASGGDLCQPEYVIDDNYHAGASNGNIQNWCDYYFEFETGRNVTRIRVICNSIGENMGVCTFDTISNYSNGVICRVKSGNSTLADVTVQTSKATVVYNADGEAIYSYIDFVPSEGTSWENVTWINIPALHSKQKETCLWEIDIFDDQECTDDTHEFVCDDCNTVLKCNACGLEKEETSHPYLAATCVELSKCVLCNATTGELSTEHDFAPATCAAPMTCKLCGVTEGDVAEEHTSVPADDGDCTTAVVCNTCKADVIPANEHQFVIDESECLNAGCRISDKEDNIAGLATITPTADETWWAVETKYIVDGNWSTACHSPKNSNFTYTFTYAEAQYLTRFIVAVNGKDFTAPRDNSNLKSSNAIKNVVINLYNVVDGEKVMVYESDRFDFDADTTEAILVLPYALQATEVTFTFNSSEQWGSSFVREIEIYKPKNIETNIASGGNPVAGGSGEVWWGVGPEYIVDGDKTTATHAPKSNDFTYTFEYAKSQLLSKVVVVANGECTTSKKVGDSDASGSHNSSAIKNVVVTLYNKSGHVIYESDRYEFTEGVTEIEIQLPYTYQASKVVVSFNSSEQWGNSFVREIEIYKTVLPNFPEGGVELDDVDFDGCWKKIKLKDAIAEAIYNKPTEDNRGTHYYAVDEDGNLILDENGNAIFITGAPIGGYSNAYGTEMDGVKETGLGIYYEGQKNGIQYNFNKQYLIKDITITYRAYCSGPNDGYDLWIGKIVNGEEVWEQVASYTASEAGYSTVKFELGEDGEGVEGSMFRFYWRAGQTARLTPTLTEVDMTLYENRCDWTVNNVLSQVSCGYDAVAECKCSRCGFEKTIVTAPATCEHNKVEITAAKAATCTDFGYNAVKQCTTCEKTFGGDRIAKSLGGHKQGTPATCTKAAVCATCGESYGDMLPHTGGEATCTAKAICSVCEQPYGEFADHVYGTAACLANTCVNCGYVNSEITATKHTYGWNIGTKIVDGKEVQMHGCSVCKTEATLDEEGGNVSSNLGFTIYYATSVSDFAKTGYDVIRLKNDVASDAGTSVKNNAIIDFGGYTYTKTGGRFQLQTIKGIVNGTVKQNHGLNALQVYCVGFIEDFNIIVGATYNDNATGIYMSYNASYGGSYINSIKNLTIDSVRDENGEYINSTTGLFNHGLEFSNTNSVIGTLDNVKVYSRGQAITIMAKQIGTMTNCVFSGDNVGMYIGKIQCSINLVNCTVSSKELAVFVKEGTASENNPISFTFDEKTSFSSNNIAFEIRTTGDYYDFDALTSAVALVDGRIYTSFEEAFAALKASTADITKFNLIGNRELDAPIVIDKAVQFSLGGGTFKLPVIGRKEFTTEDAPGYTLTALNGAFVVKEGGSLTI
ncbi:MAG: hypothetical protein II984_02115, partial [Clostridia bacterium]|nr:hypothetical protein [Clostridia bacterium]